MKWLLFSVAFAGAFLLEFHPVFAAKALQTSGAKTCTSEVIASCAELEKGPLDLAKTKSFSNAKPGAIVNTLPFIDSFGDQAKNTKLAGDLVVFTNPSANQIANAENLGKKLRDRAIAMILGVPTGSTAAKELTTRDKLKTMSAEKRIAIERLQTLNFKVVDGRNKFCRVQMTEGIPNAAYDEDRHSVFLCQAMASQNEAAIAYALSHELGHVISPTATSLLQYKINGKTAEDTWELARACDPNFVYSEEASYNDEEAAYLNEALSVNATHVLAPSNTRVLDTLEHCGVVTSVENSSTKNADAFKTSRMCVEALTKPAYEAALKKYAPLEAAKLNISITSAHQSIMNRLPPLHFGAAAEEFADTFAGKLFGDAVPEMNWSAADIRASMIGYRVASCQQSRPGDATRDPESYPPADDRIRHQLSHPNIAKALGCTPPPSTCEFKIDPTKPVAPQATSIRSTVPGATKAKSSGTNGASK